MSPHKRTAAVAAALMASSLLVPAGGALAAPTPDRAPQPAKGLPARLAVSRTSATEVARVDRVSVKPQWYACYGGYQCATVKVPLDYDNPKGAKTELGLLKSPATDRTKKKLGTLFVNPGGPSGSSVQMAMYAPDIFSKSVTARYDVVGIDPRGVLTSQQLKCFADVRSQTLATQGLNISFPANPTQQKAYMASAAKLAKGCSTTGRPLSAHMSTADVARDMDVVRRAVGDRKLNFMGWSYGTQLGQVYAGLFPDRVNRIVIDGVLDAEKWTGTQATRNVPVTIRLDSDKGAWKALKEVFRRCDAAGADHCAVAGHSQARWEGMAARLKRGPITLDYGEGVTDTWTYQTLVNYTLSALYGPTAGDDVAFMLAMLETYSAKDTTGDDRAAAANSLRKLKLKVLSTQSRRGFDFPYDNSLEVFSGVLCGETRNPAVPGQWPRQIAARTAVAPYFAEAWGWSSVQCAEKNWTAKAGDAYPGPWNKVTSAPVLVVGNYWDPATNYSGAVNTARRMGNARLLASDSWGHTAYGTSACATGVVDKYLVEGTLPNPGTTCVGDQQPFTQKLSPDEGQVQVQSTSAKKTGSSTKRPGIAPAPRPAAPGANR